MLRNMATLEKDTTRHNCRGSKPAKMREVSEPDFAFILHPGRRPVLNIIKCKCKEISGNVACIFFILSLDVTVHHF
jgi:hypothetical protein